MMTQSTTTTETKKLTKKSTLIEGTTEVLSIKKLRTNECVIQNK